jgi:hypothetical protein
MTRKMIFCRATKMQGCQMVYFPTKNSTLGKFFLLWKMVVHFVAILVYFTVISYILWPVGTYILWSSWYIFPDWVCYTTKNLATLPKCCRTTISGTAAFRLRDSNLSCCYLHNSVARQKIMFRAKMTGPYLAAIDCMPCCDTLILVCSFVSSNVGCRVKISKAGFYLRIRTFFGIKPCLKFRAFALLRCSVCTRVHQANQFGRILVYWATVYFGKISKITEVAHFFCMEETAQSWF